MYCSPMHTIIIPQVVTDITPLKKAESSSNWLEEPARRRMKLYHSSHSSPSTAHTITEGSDCQRDFRAITILRRNVKTEPRCKLKGILRKRRNSIGCPHDNAGFSWCCLTAPRRDQPVKIALQRLRFHYCE